MAIGDEARTAEVVRATIDYADRTEEEHKLGTYCYLFDNLLLPKRRPPLTSGQEKSIVDRFERRFSEMTTPGNGWDADPHGTKEVGERLASYYVRNGQPEEQERIFGEIGKAFERRAKLGDALAGMFFLQDARKYYQKAGLREESERVQHESQQLGPEAEKRMVRVSVKGEIPTDEVDRFLDAMMEGGPDEAIPRFAVSFIPDQHNVAAHMQSAGASAPLFSMFFDVAKKLGHGHIEADVGDNTGDPDGLAVHRTATVMQYDIPWIGWSLERLRNEGVTASTLVEFLQRCPAFAGERAPLLQQGITAHFEGDFVQSIHLLIPQIERALVKLPPLVGKPSNKAHRTGRGVMQFKNLNDVLLREQWPLAEADTENLRMYLLATLAHPKGLNIRNDVCHGLWEPEQFTQAAGERVLHTLLAVAFVVWSHMKPLESATAEEPPAATDSAADHQEREA